MSDFDQEYAHLTNPHQIHSNLKNRIFYHGTSKRAARKILAHGLRDYALTAETPFLKYKARQGIDRWLHGTGGTFGRGTYITCNWRSALYFGPVLFRLELQPATRIIRLDLPPEPKVLDSLKREFGREILTASPWKVISKNKRLTLEEAIQLARYHRSNCEKVNFWLRRPHDSHEPLMFDLRKILVRYGIHGWGEATGLCGLVIFATDRLKVAEVILSMPTRELREQAFDQDRCYRDYASLDALVKATRSASNPGAANSLGWVNAANGSLREKCS